MRLVFVEFLGADEFEALSAVGRSAAVEFLESGDFGLVDGDDDLAAHLVLDAALVAELPQKPAAGGAEVGLLRTGSVVDARVYDAGVVACLVLGDDGLLLDDDDLLVGMLLGDPHRGGESDDAAADDGDVVVS